MPDQLAKRGCIDNWQVTQAGTGLVMFKHAAAGYIVIIVIFIILADPRNQ